ncbi:MAG TPA: hypothetical protein VHV79_09460 [Mycobacteriales bacterium]|nr:hypothetical protein [Mycobacteriales bacterium]
MGHDELDVGGVGSSGAEELTSGPSRGHGPRRPAMILLAVAALIAVAVIVHGGGSKRRPLASPPPPAAASAAPAPPHGPARAAPPLTSRVKLPLLGVTAGWELYGRGPTDVVRIQFARGVVTRTTVPALGSSGPVSFGVGPQGALIRPLDFVSGYLVPDGHFARPLPVTESHGGQLVPGPRRGQFWVQDATHSRLTVSLIDRNGEPTGVGLRLPFSQFSLASDGSGYPLVITRKGGYDARPGRLRRISGNVQAVGRAGLLTLRCDRRSRCENVLIDPRDGSRSALRHEVDSDTGEPIGVIAADGRFAAVPNPISDGAGTVRLVNLATGEGHTLRMALPDQDFDTELAFSPDSRWLFVATANGKLDVVRTSTGRIRSLRVSLPPVTQLVIRPADQKG